MSPVRPTVQVVGRRMDAEHYRLRDFLTRTAQPYEWQEAGAAGGSGVMSGVWRPRRRSAATGPRMKANGRRALPASRLPHAHRAAVRVAGGGGGRGERRYVRCLETAPTLSGNGAEDEGEWTPSTTGFATSSRAPRSRTSGRRRGRPGGAALCQVFGDRADAQRQRGRG